MKVRSYLLLMVLVTIVPIIVFSGLSLAKLHESHRNTSRQNQIEIARAVALAIDQDLASARSALRVLAASTYLENGDFENFHQHARIANIGDTGWIILYDANGDQLVNTRVPYGVPVVTTRNRAEVREVIEKKEVSVSNMFYGKTVRSNVVALEMPVILPSGKKYVVSQVFLPRHFDRALKDHANSGDWLIGIFDRSGTILSRSARASDYVGKPVVSSMRVAMQSVREGDLRHRTSEGVDVHDVFTRSQLSGWVVAVGAPVSLIERELNHATRLWIAGLLITIFFAGLFAAYLGRRLVRSIGSAADTAALLGRGEKPEVRKGSRIQEVEKLNNALVDAGTLLAQERESRATAERERETLFEGERRARQAAEELSQAKDKFLAMLSHELRNPINAITAAVSVFDLNLARDATTKALAVIRRQSTHLRHIVDDLLDVSRAISGRLQLNRQKLDLSRIVDGSIAALRTAGRLDQHVLDLSVESVWVDADPVRIEQVVMNLLDNAIKYTPHGGSIGLELHAENGEVVLIVLDNGIGIAEELLPQIFDVFVQADYSLDRSRGGLGIGLSLVKELVRLHDGKVSAESPGIGHGSRFTVRLPHTEAPPGQEAGDAAASHAGKTRVLLVEDNDDARELFALMLGYAGHEVLQARNGLEGLNVAAKEVPGFAFIDIGLPEMNGYEVARKLRSEARTAGMALVALSGYGTAEDLRKSSEAGFDHHLVKPVKVTDLIATMVTLEKARNGTAGTSDTSGTSDTN